MQSFSFFLFGRKDIVHDDKLFCLKKVGKRNKKFRRSGTLSRYYALAYNLE